MDVREKLVELMCDVLEDGCIGHCNHPPCWKVTHAVDGLIANGVTVQENTEITDELLKQLRNAPLTILHEEPTIEVVQEWISVKDRLPDRPMKCLVYTKRGEYGGYEITYYNQGFYTQYADVTHWTPLPDAPEVKND